MHEAFHHVLIIVQARMESHRLPGKSLLPFGNFTLVTYLLHRLKTIPAMELITAIPDSKTSDVLYRDLKSDHFNVFRGSEHNVWQRFSDVLNLREFNEIKHFIRVTADNPFTSLRCIQEGLLTHIKERADLTVIKNCPVGAGVDIIRSDTFKSIDMQALSTHEKEHIIPFFLNHSFNIAEHVSHFPKQSSHLRWTIDTWDDYLNGLNRLNGCENPQVELS